MVRIIGYKERQKENGKKFYVLEVQGGIEMVRSETTGNYYATAKKATISSTFDEQTCLAMIGTEMQGNVVKQECEPYSYIVRETGEELILNHRYVYVPETSKDIIPTGSLGTEIQAFSKNGHTELATLEI